MLNSPIALVLALLAPALLALAATPAARADDGPADLRVMTYNVRFGTADDGPDRWEARRGLFFETIRDSEADLIGFQEALKAQIDETLAEFPAYRSAGVGRDDGREAGEFSNILYRAERFELLDSGTFWLSDTPEAPGSKSWGNRIPRICTWARLRDRQDGGRLDVYNTHFDHQSAPSRLRSAVAIAAHLRSRPDPAPFVLTGDFNAGEDSPPLAFLRGEAPGPDGEAPPSPGLVDTFRVAHPEAQDVGTFHGFRGTATGAKIDAILIEPDAFEVLDAEIVRTQRDGRHPSDHFPVTARLRRRD